MKASLKIMAGAALLTLTTGASAGITAPSAAGGMLAVTATLGGTDFVQTGFNYQTSSGVLLGANQNAVKFVVAASHQKGRFTYAGDSEGGSVAACEATPVAAGFTAAAAPTVTDACGGRS